MTSLSDYVEIVKVLWPSLIAAAAVGIAASVVGVFVLLRRDALVALAMPHTVAVGAAIGLRMGWPTLPPALAAVVLAVILLVWSKKHGANHWFLPSLYIAALCLSFLIIANSGEHVAELQALFTGIDVAVSPQQACISAPIMLISAGICAMLWRRWLLFAQAPASAEAAGLYPARWELGFLCLLATVFLLGTSSLGVVMVVAMLFLPAATVLPWVRRIPAAMVGSCVMAIAFIAAGLVLSVEWSLPLSQSVGGVGFVVLICSYLISTRVN